MGGRYLLFLSAKKQVRCDHLKCPPQTVISSLPKATCGFTYYIHSCSPGFLHTKARSREWCRLNFDPFVNRHAFHSSMFEFKCFCEQHDNDLDSTVDTYHVFWFLHCIHKVLLGEGKNQPPWQFVKHY
jgi:hypothetical protein